MRFKEKQREGNEKEKKKCFIVYINIKLVFEIGTAVSFESIFCLEIYQNNIFLFFKFIFYISTSKPVRIIIKNFLKTFF
jgi:hypothetical protein